jgi:hypothetical protein
VDLCHAKIIIVCHLRSCFLEVQVKKLLCPRALEMFHREKQVGGTAVLIRRAPDPSPVLCSQMKRSLGSLDYKTFKDARELQGQQPRGTMFAAIPLFPVAR